jgi:hypothetical protein
MARYTVELHIFLCDGDDIEVSAANEIEAEALAKQIVEKRFYDGFYDRPSLSEICTSNVSQTGPADPWGWG